MNETDYKITMTKQGEWIMPYNFTPEQRIENILHVIRTLDEIMRETDSLYAELYRQQLIASFVHLNTAISDMKNTEVQP